MNLDIKTLVTSVITAVLLSIVSAFITTIIMVNTNEVEIKSIKSNLENEISRLSSRIDKLNDLIDREIPIVTAKSSERLNESSQRIEKSLIEIKTLIDGRRKDIDALKLFVVKAHPDKEHKTLLSSIEKLDGLNFDELKLVAYGMENSITIPSSGAISLKLDERYINLIKSKGINKKDMMNFKRIIHTKESPISGIPTLVNDGKLNKE